MSSLKPFNYLTDGAYTRSGVAWYTLADGTVDEAAADTRRVALQSDGDRWIWVEGPRENHIEAPLDTTALNWDIPAPGTLGATLPDGSVGFPGAMNSSGVLEQIFDTGSRAVLITASAYVRGVAAAQTASLGITNGTPGTFSGTSAPIATWARATRKAISLVAAGNKTFRMTASIAPSQMLAWGCGVESGPAWTDARFMSQPILVLGSRAAELYTAGVITADMVAKAPSSIFISFKPEFSNSDLVLGNQFTVCYLNTGVAATSIRIWIEGTGAGVCRLRAGNAAGSYIETGNISFSEGQTISVYFYAPAGDLSVFGVTGAGSFFGFNSYPFVAGMETIIGSDPASANPAYALIGPFQLEYTSTTLVSIDQLTLNSARLVFNDDVLQFDPNGLHDALNPGNYEVGGTPGWPNVQYVQPGDVANEVVLFFDDDITPGTLITIQGMDVVGAPVPIPMDPFGSDIVQFIAFGGEVNVIAQAQATYPRVDIGNPQTERDASQGAALGTFGVTDAGDLANDHGRAYLRKRVFRRLATAKAGFFHLPGYGLAQPSKDLFTPTSLRRLKVDVEAQVRQEPGVLAALATVTEVRPGVVAVKLRIQDDNGSFELEGALDFTAE